MVQSDDSADVNPARDARTAPRHANRFLKICNLNDSNILRLSTAIIALGEIKDYQSNECLRAIIEDPERDLFVREGAIRALNNKL